MNKLRKAIFANVGHDTYDDNVDAILDAVLNEIEENTTQDHANCPLPQTCTGYMSALEDVRYLLNSAKKENP